MHVKHRSAVGRRREEQGRSGAGVTLPGVAPWPRGSAWAWQHGLPIGSPSFCLQQRGLPGTSTPGGSRSPPKGCHPHLVIGRETWGITLPLQGCALLGLILEGDLEILEAFLKILQVPRIEVDLLLSMWVMSSN